MGMKGLHAEGRVHYRRHAPGSLVQQCACGGGIYVTNRERTPKGPGNDDSIDAVLFLPPSSMYPNWVGASSVSSEG